MNEDEDEDESGVAAMTSVNVRAVARIVEQELRRALESIRSIDCRCGIAGACGCGDEAKSIAEDALSDVYGCPRCFGLGNIDDSSPDAPHARRTCEDCSGVGLLQNSTGAFAQGESR